MHAQAKQMLKFTSSQKYEVTTAEYRPQIAIHLIKFKVLNLRPAKLLVDKFVIFVTLLNYI